MPPNHPFAWNFTLYNLSIDQAGYSMSEAATSKLAALSTHDTLGEIHHGLLLPLYAAGSGESSAAVESNENTTSKPCKKALKAQHLPKTWLKKNETLNQLSTNPTGQQTLLPQRPELLLGI